MRLGRAALTLGVLALAAILGAASRGAPQRETALPASVVLTPQSGPHDPDRLDPCERPEAAASLYLWSLNAAQLAALDAALADMAIDMDIEANPLGERIDARSPGDALEALSQEHEALLSATRALTASCWHVAHRYVDVRLSNELALTPDSFAYPAGSTRAAVHSMALPAPMRAASQLAAWAVTGARIVRTSDAASARALAESVTAGAIGERTFALALTEADALAPERPQHAAVRARARDVAARADALPEIVRTRIGALAAAPVTTARRFPALGLGAADVLLVARLGARGREDAAAREIARN